MTRSANSILDRIISIVAELAMLDPSELNADSMLADLSIDSLGVIELVYAIEESFNVELPFDANNPDSGLFDFASIGSIVTAVEDLLFEGNG